MAKALIVYATRTGETQNIAELIAEGVRFSGHEADVVGVKEIKNETDLNGYDGYVFGSATYHGEMLQGMKTFLFLAEKANLENKVAIVTGAASGIGLAQQSPIRYCRSEDGVCIAHAEVRKKKTETQNRVG